MRSRMIVRREVLDKQSFGGGGVVESKAEEKKVEGDRGAAGGGARPTLA